MTPETEAIRDAIDSDRLERFAAEWDGISCPCGIEHSIRRACCRVLSGEILAGDFLIFPEDRGYAEPACDVVGQDAADMEFEVWRPKETSGATVPQKDKETKP